MCRSVARLLALWKDFVSPRSLSGHGSDTPSLASIGRQRRVRRWAREIVLAAILTVAAAAFIAAALLRGNGDPQDAPPFETARKAGHEIAPILRPPSRYCAVQPPSIE